MKKSNYYLMFLLILFITKPAFAENRAVEISINGIGPPVDAAAYATVRQVIGHAVADGVIDKFVVYSYGIEGGFSACAEAASVHGQVEDIDDFVRQLHTIRPNPQTTAYSVEPVESCAIDVGVCTLDVRQCADGSFVGRVPPSCNFAPCPGTQ
jgi:hypothetical protein